MPCSVLCSGPGSTGSCPLRAQRAPSTRSVLASAPRPGPGRRCQSVSPLRSSPEPRSSAADAGVTTTTGTTDPAEASDLPAGEVAAAVRCWPATVAPTWRAETAAAAVTPTAAAVAPRTVLRHSGVRPRLRPARGAVPGWGAVRPEHHDGEDRQSRNPRSRPCAAPGRASRQSHTGLDRRMVAARRPEAASGGQRRRARSPLSGAALRCGAPPCREP